MSKKRRKTESSISAAWRNKLARRMGSRKANALREILGDTRFSIIAKQYLKRFDEKLEKRKQRAEKKAENFLERKGLSAEKRARLRLLDTSVQNREYAYAVKKKNGYYYVFIGGKVMKVAHGEKKAEAMVKRLDYERNIALMRRSLDIGRAEARAFIKAIRASEKREYKRLAKKVNRLPRGKRARARRALKMGQLKGRAFDWQIKFLLKVLTGGY